MKSFTVSHPSEWVNDPFGLKVDCLLKIPYKFIDGSLLDDHLRIVLNSRVKTRSHSLRNLHRMKCTDQRRYPFIRNLDFVRFHRVLLSININTEVNILSFRTLQGRTGSL